jgi:hypothetical protein
MKQQAAIGKRLFLSIGKLTVAARTTGLYPAVVGSALDSQVAKLVNVDDNKQYLFDNLNSYPADWLSQEQAMRLRADKQAAARYNQETSDSFQKVHADMSSISALADTAYAHQPISEMEQNLASLTIPLLAA